jgi:hypothetical protein
MLFANRQLNELDSESLLRVLKEEIIKIDNHKGQWEPTVTLPDEDKTTLGELTELSKSMHNMEDMNLRYTFIEAGSELLDEEKISKDLWDDIKVAFIEKPWMKT